jgi:uncharacterized protein
MAIVRKNNLQFFISFAILFILYHGAEYMIVFKNSIPGFFALQALFFVAAWILGKWYSANGLSAWGLLFNTKTIRNLFIGMIAGILIYGITFFLSIRLGIETIVSVPPTATIIKKSLPFVLGVFFSSLSEDVLTRGTIYAHYNTKVKPGFLVLLSASVYLFNHIYRLADGLEAWSYIFLLGIIFIIPLVLTKQLWLTAGMHWAGNSFFFISHSVVITGTGNSHFSSNYLFAIILAAFIPALYYGLKRNLTTEKEA